MTLMAFERRNYNFHKAPGSQYGSPEAREVYAGIAEAKKRSGSGRELFTRASS